MVPVDRNVGREGEAPSEPCDQGSRGTATSPTIARGSGRASTSRTIVRLVARLLLPLGLTGCQSFSSPLAQWRAAYDSNLYKGLSPEEMADASGPADSNNFLQRWLAPRKNPAGNDPPASTLVLGSNGWRPIAKPAPNPKADAEFQAAFKLFQQGKFAEAETAVRQDRQGQGPQGDHLGRECPVLPGRVSVSAEEVRPRPRKLR